MCPGLVSTGYGPDESGELANTRLCVAGSNEIGSDLFDEGRLSAPGLAYHPAARAHFWSQATDGLAVLCTGLVG